MIHFDNYANENRTEYNKNWPYIPDHPYRILIIGGSGSGKNEFIIKFNRKPARHWQNIFICKRFIWIKISIFN